MKKFIVLFVIIVQFICLSACADYKQLGRSNHMNDKKEVVLYLNSISVLVENDIYFVVIKQDDKAEKSVTFSKNRKASNIDGLKLQKINDIKEFLGKDMETIETFLGEVHADAGSGFYIPSYITDDGFLVSFLIENNIVYEVIKRDLLSGEVVEKFLTEEG